MIIQDSRLKIQGPNQTLRTPHSAFRIQRERGFTYIALLAAIVIIGISLAAAGKYWSNILQREKEEELLFRGDQYVKAIERYAKAIPGVVRTPASIDDLLNDSRLMNRHHLRRRYKDPITGEDFVEMFSIIGGQTKQLIGVHSSSDKEPLKQSNFPAGPNDPPYFKDFEGKKKYSEWQFVYGQQTTPPVIPPPPNP
jgi:type II secretory pathway pseudopilin PulG